MPKVIKPYPTQPFALPPNPGVRTVEPAPVTSRAREDVPPPQDFTPIHYIDPASLFAAQGSSRHAVLVPLPR